MAFLEQDAKNIASGWGPEPQLHAPEIGPTLAAILTNRRLQQQQTQDTLTAAIKAQQDRNQASAYGSALQSAGVVPGGVDLSHMSGPDLSKLAALYQETIPDTDLDKSRQAEAYYHNTVADAIKNGTYGAGRGSTTPRVWRQLPNGEWSQFTPQEAYKIDVQGKSTDVYNKLVQAEADATGKMTMYQKKYGTDTDTGMLAGNPTPQDQQAFLQASQDASRLKKQREEYAKLYHGSLRPDELPTQQDDGLEDGDTTPYPQSSPTPQTSATPPQSPGITPTPIPGASSQPSASPSASPPTVSAGSAGGHASTYGVNPQQVRQMAIQQMQKQGIPQTESNIQEAIRQITGG